MNLKETHLRIPPKIISQTRTLNVATLRNINEKKGKPKEIFVFKRLQLNTLGVIGVISIADSLMPQNADNTHHYKAASACILWHPWLDLGGSPPPHPSS